MHDRTPLPPLRNAALALAATALMSAAAHESSLAGSLRFHGNGSDDLDRVKILVEQSPVTSPDPAVDVGAADFTLELWMKALPGENGAGPCGTGNDNWITGNIVLDRDVYFAGDYGDFGVSLFSDGIAFGVHNGTSGEGICGGGPLADGLWHHLAAVRRVDDGWIAIFVDGALVSSAFGPGGDLSYREGRSGFPNDPFLVVGAEKHDAGPAYPSFSGWVDELRVSNAVRYAADFPRPTAPFAPDPSTAALYHFDEGAGDVAFDVSGATPGPSDGQRRFGGSPAGPEWSAESPFGGPVTVDGSSVARASLRVWPQPSRGAVWFEVSLPAASDLRLDLFDVGGRLMRSLATGRAGSRHGLFWDGRDHRGLDVPPGIYRARLRGAGMELVRSIVLAR